MKYDKGKKPVFAEERKKKILDDVLRSLIMALRYFMWVTVRLG